MADQKSQQSRSPPCLSSPGGSQTQAEIDRMLMPPPPLPPSARPRKENEAMALLNHSAVTRERIQRALWPFSPRPMSTQPETGKTPKPLPTLTQQPQSHPPSTSPPRRILSPQSPRRVLTPRPQPRQMYLYAQLSHIRQYPASFASVSQEPNLEEETEEEYVVDMVQQGCSRAEAIRSWSMNEHASLVERALKRARRMGTGRRLEMRPAPGCNVVQAGPSRGSQEIDGEDDDHDNEEGEYGDEESSEETVGVGEGEHIGDDERMLD